MRKLGTLFYQALVLFNNRRGTTLAAASTFYIIISIVPLTLLLIRLLGFVIGDLSRGSDEIFFYLEQFVPDVSPELFDKVKDLIAGPLFGGAHVTTINLVLLFLSSLSFFNSIWNGLYLITNDKTYLSFWKNVKGVVIIGMTIGLLCCSLLIPKALIWAVSSLQNNFVTDFIWDFFPILRPYVDWMRTFSVEKLRFFTSMPFFLLIFVSYFTLLYRWFFSWKLPYFNSFIAALTFVLTLMMGKNLFWIYFLYVRENLVRNYGDFYTLIVGLMWLFLVMCFFYFGACLSHVMRSEPLYRNTRLFLSSFVHSKLERSSKDD